MKDYLLVGATSSTNYGDNVICDTFKGLLYKSTGVNPELVNIEYTPWILKLLIVVLNICCASGKKDKVVHKLRRLLLIKKLSRKNYDVIFVGGQLFFDYFVPYINLFVDASKLTNSRVYFYACGMGRLNDENKKLLKQSLNEDNVELVSVRDSIHLMGELSPKVVFKPDVAICCEAVYGNVRNELKGERVVGLGVISVDYYNKNNPKKKISKQEYVDMLSEMIRRLWNNGRKVELFCNGEEEDYAIALEISKALELQVDVAKRPQNPKDLINLISRYEYVIASRLHALIVSYSYNIPFVGLGWDNKVKEFFDLVGHSERCFDLSLINKIDVRQMLLELNEGIDLAKQMECKTEIISCINSFRNNNK